MIEETLQSLKENDFQARLLYPAKAKGKCGHKTFKLLIVSCSQENWRTTLTKTKEQEDMGSRTEKTQHKRGGKGQSQAGWVTRPDGGRPRPPGEIPPRG